MPKRLFVHPNERIDIPDFVNASSEFTSQKSAFSLDKTFRDNVSRVLRGFEVSFNGNQITVFNGAAVDRSGEILNSEDQPNASRTITIPNTPFQSYFVELFFTESASDSDGRAFWDPTYSNPNPIPAGREFRLNVSTRYTPDWDVDFNTTGFAVDTNPSSNRVPLLRLFTGSGGDIDPLASGCAFSTGVLSTVTTSDLVLGVTVLPVVDATAFLIGDAVTLDVFGTAPEGAVITNIDYTNALLTLSAPTAAPHSAGSIVRRVSGSSFLLQETNPDATPSQADARNRLFQGSEIRGSALVVDRNASVATDRSDLSVFTVKDEVDFLAAQLRELKFGSLRSDTNQASPPRSFASQPRYFDNAGGVAGARTASISVGDGVDSFGDFNGTDELPFLAAVAWLQSVTGQSGVVFVKRGSYQITTPIQVPSNISFVGEGRKVTTLTNLSATDPIFELSNVTPGTRDVTFAHIGMDRDALASTDVVTVLDDQIRVVFDDCELLGDVRSLASGTVAVYGQDTLFASVAFASAAGNLRVSNCDFLAVSSSSSNVSGPISDSVIDSCRFFSGTGIQATTASGLFVNKASFLTSQLFVASTSASNVLISDCTYSASATGPLAVVNIASASNVFVTNLSASSTQPGSSAVSRGALIRFSGASTNVRVTGGRLTSNSASFIDGVVFDTTGGGALTNVDVDGVLCTDTFDAVRFDSGATLSSLSVRALHTRSTGAGKAHRGVRMTHLSGGRCFLSVSNCVFDRLDGTEASTTVAGVLIQGTASNIHQVNVSDCMVRTSSSINNSYGVIALGSSLVTRALTVSGLTLDVFGPPPFAALLRATNCDNVRVTNCTVLGLAASNTDVISLFNCTNATVSNNTLTNGVTDSGTIVSLTDCANASVTSNSLSLDTSTAMSAVVASSGGLVRGTDVSGNTITVSRSTAGGTPSSAIAILGTSFDSVTAVNNTITSLGVGDVFFISCNPTNTSYNLIVKGNSLYETGTPGLASLPIFVRNFNNFDVSSNVLRASTTATRSASANMRVESSDFGTINGNTVQFGETRSLQLVACDHVAVTGNVLQSGYAVPVADIQASSGSSNLVIMNNLINFISGIIDVIGATVVLPSTGGPPYTKDAASIQRFNICANVFVV